MKKSLTALLALLLALCLAPALAQDTATGVSTGAVTPFEDQTALSVEGAFTYQGSDVYALENGGKFTYSQESKVFAVTEGCVAVSGTSEAEVRLGDGLTAALENGGVEYDAATGAARVLSGKVRLTGSSASGVSFGSLTVAMNGSAVTVDSTARLITVDGGSVTLRGSENATVETVNNAAVVLNGVSLTGCGGPGLRVRAPYSTALELAAGSTNVINGSGGNWAGVEVEWNSGAEFASLTIDGAGSLSAAGSGAGAGIGGSKAHHAVYGNITINGGSITATGGTNSAGLGSAENSNAGSSNGSYKHVESRWGAITINGGSVTATGAVGGNGGAGIGGGNHVDSGIIVINDGTVNAYGHAGIGSGYGSSQTTSKTNLTKGPGYYYADITINGGNITAEARRSGGDTNDGGAGIGGGMYSDAIVRITGGNITAYGGGGKGSNSFHHGAAGIGGGYEGHAEVTITGGVINAYGGGAGAGIGSGAIPNQNLSNEGSKGYKCHYGETTCAQTVVRISKGTVTAEGGVSGGAGIGGGVGADKVAVFISGGTVTADGAKSSSDAMRGGAGIGSGYSGLTSGESGKYFEETYVCNVSVTGGAVKATGGWGAAGIGSGADNAQAGTVDISAAASVQAYSDGTKFALDTKRGGDWSTSSLKSGRDIHQVLQGTFIQTEGSFSHGSKIPVKVTGGASRELSLPTRYRSFAVSVPNGEYNIRVGGELYGNSNSEFSVKNGANAGDDSQACPDQGPAYTVSGGFVDAFYLNPVRDIAVEKIWDDGDNMDGQRDQTAEITLTLYKNGEQNPVGTITLNRQNNWKSTVRNLIKYKGDWRSQEDANTYFVVENDVPDGYAAAYSGTMADGLTVTNSHTPQMMRLSGVKTWVDDGNRDGLRPAGVTVMLLANGSVVNAQYVTGTGDSWAFAFENLPRYQAGKPIAYTLAEVSVPGYTSVVSGMNITNTHTPAVTTVSGTKTWEDQDDADGLRPQSITVNLLANGKQVDSQTVTGTGNSWSYSFPDLPRYANGKQIEYTVSENEVPGYTASVSGTAITNTHTPEEPEEPEEKLYTLIVRYWADGEKVFPDFKATHKYGDSYHVVSPALAGYTADQAFVEGVITQDTERDVYYTPAEVRLTVFYQFLDGATAAPTVTEKHHAGDAYAVVTPLLEGYIPSTLVVQGVMPGYDVQYVVIYVPSYGGGDVDDPDPRKRGKLTLIDDFETPLGLGTLDLNAGECFD